MRVTFNINKGELDKFDASCTAAISKLGNGSRKALIEACEIIMEESMAQVPQDTQTLIMSAFYEITGYWKTGWDAVLGYGGNGDPVNPKTGKRASEYMVKVHEDLTAFHMFGKAKYLEDPVKDYAAERFPRTVFKYAKASLADMSS